MQFRLFLNMPLSSCKFKYNKRNSSCLFLVSLCLCLNHKELNKKVIHDLSAGQSWKSQMRLGSRENNLWFYLLVASLVVLQPLRWCCVDCVIHHERDVREEQHHTYMWREQAIIEWSWHVNFIVLAATVRSFAHMPLGISDRNSSMVDILPYESKWHVQCTNTKWVRV